jgi:hypothetical protein
MTADDNRLSWVYGDSALVARLNTLWPGWEHSDSDSGLVPQLDQTPEWDWDAWSTEDKQAYLNQLLNGWFPPEGDGSQERTDRLAWVYEDAALTDRLNTNWPGWAEANGLAATLDTTVEWNGWDVWEAQDKRDYLAVTLDSWYPPADGAEPPAVALASAHTELVAEPAAEPVVATSPADLEAGLAEALARVRETVPGAADLSTDELGNLLSEVLHEQLAVRQG